MANSADILACLKLLRLVQGLRRVVSNRAAVHIPLSRRVVILGWGGHFQAGNWRYTSHGV